MFVIVFKIYANYLVDQNSFKEVVVLVYLVKSSSMVQQKADSYHIGSVC